MRLSLRNIVALFCLCCEKGEGLVSKKIILLLSWIVMPLYIVALDQSQDMYEEQEAQASELVYLSPQLQTALLKLEKALPDYAWSSAFNKICQNIDEGKNNVAYESIMGVVDEGLALIALHEYDISFDNIKADLQEYQRKLLMNGDHCKSCKFKKICNLCVRLLAVTNALTVNGC